MISHAQFIYEDIIKSKFKIIKREDPTYLLKAIKNNNRNKKYD